MGVNTTELAEATTAASAASSANIIQSVIDTNILEYQRRYSPLLAAIPTKQINTTAYKFAQRTARPSGGAVTDGGAATRSRSTWVQPSFNIKLYQAQGGVTGYAQAVTAGVVGDLYRSEVDGAVQSLMWSVETAMCWANANATANSPYPTMDGLDTQVSSYSGGTQNAIDAAEGNLTLSLLDQVIDLVETNAAMPIGSDWMFVSSSTAVSKIAGLLTAQQRFNDRVEVAAGLNVGTYRDIPLVKSGFLAPRGNAMGTVTTATSTTGGTLASGTYKYQVSAVIDRFGEIGVAAEVSQAATGSTSTITLSFSTPTAIEGAGPIVYKVYRTASGGSTGTETLLGYVSAYDSTGTATTSIVDTGATLLPNTDTAVTGTNDTYALIGKNAGVKPRSSTDHEIFLIPRTPDFLVRPYVRDFFVKPLAQTTTEPDVEPFYVQSDTTLAVRAPKYVGRLSRVAVSL